MAAVVCENGTDFYARENQRNLKRQIIDRFSGRWQDDCIFGWDHFFRTNQASSPFDLEPPSPEAESVSDGLEDKNDIELENMPVESANLETRPTLRKRLSFTGNGLSSLRAVPPSILYYVPNILAIGNNGKNLLTLDTQDIFGVSYICLVL
jgi:hypothetical protein